ncbi:MAG: RsmE family RNA methyltransferase [Erysipelotrichaceae bacterium]|nr:RsmE family RNA methyltransferase [Erysipelotrichaceae bacterium]
MQQYFLDQKINCEQKIEFNQEQQHHIAHVLRMKQDTVVRIVDEENHVFLASIHYENQLPYAMVQQQLMDTDKNVEIILVASLIKKEKWEYVLQKAAELGATMIVPFISSRTIVKTSNEKEERKLARWNKIVLEACEQSHQAHRTKVVKPITIKDLPNYLVDVNLVAYEKENVSKHFVQYLKKDTSTLILIGPEGGFEEKEIDQFMKMGIQPCSLGKRILRAETAGLYALSVLDAYNEVKE